MLRKGNRSMLTIRGQREQRPAGFGRPRGATRKFVGRSFVLACVVPVFAGLMAGTAYGAADVGPGSAPRMEFAPLRAGTYQLQSIQPVREATLLDEAGQPVKLSTLTQGKVTLLTFFYTYCVDPLGCPFVHETLTQLRARIVADKDLARDVRFVGISCDPTNDTPEALSQFAKSFHSDSPFEWRFLTTPGVRTLLPVLDDFGQDVSVELDKRGRPSRTLHHMLKVFLIDARGTVREIYTLAFIQPEVMLNDIRTLHMEQTKGTSLARR
jgi:cytochrome oxidase Cu insertion factor (SCO1/SenC/PrrC family)